MKAYKGCFDWLNQGIEIDWEKDVVLWCNEQLRFEREKALIQEWGSFKLLLNYEEGKDCFLFLKLESNDSLNDGEGYELIRKRMFEGKENYQILIKEGGYISVLRFPIKGCKKVWQCCSFGNENGSLRLFWYPCIFDEDFLKEFENLKAERQ